MPRVGFKSRRPSAHGRHVHHLADRIRQIRFQPDPDVPSYEDGYAAQEAFLNPGNKYKIPLETLSLNLALVLGTAGLPHILTRFFTVKDAKTARGSVVYATWIIGIFYVMTIFLGFGVAAFVGAADITEVDKAGNMVARSWPRRLAAISCSRSSRRLRSRQSSPW